MKKLGFLLSIILIGLLAIGMVAASENTTSNDNNQVASQDENAELVQNSAEQIESATENSYLPQTDSSDNEVDLSIHGTFREYNYHRNVELTVEVINFNGIAHNTNVNVEINDGLRFIDYKTNKGTYNSKTGIWNIGDLNENKYASLKLKFEVEKYKEYVADLKVTTDSKDTDPSNNRFTEVIPLYDANTINNDTTGLDEIEHNKHRSHYRSSASGLVSRSVTKSVNISEPEAASVEKPTANPIIALLISIALIGITRRD